MRASPTVHSHIGMTNTMVRLYIFLTQHMDRCVSEAARISYPESELQSHLASTRAELMEMLSVNQVVKRKVEEECQRVLALVTACRTEGAGQTVALNDLKAERVILQHKTMALSDLLAVFRAA